MKSMYENHIATIINALDLEDEREEVFVESIIHDALDPYEFYGEDKYSSPAEALRDGLRRVVIVFEDHDLLLLHGIRPP